MADGRFLDRNRELRRLRASLTTETPGLMVVYGPDGVLDALR